MAKLSSKESRKEVVKLLEVSLKGRIAYSPSELVKIGIFGSRQGIYGAIQKGLLKAAYVSIQKVIIPKQCLIEYLLKMNE